MKQIDMLEKYDTMHMIWWMREVLEITIGKVNEEIVNKVEGKEIESRTKGENRPPHTS